MYGKSTLIALIRSQWCLMNMIISNSNSHDPIYSTIKLILPDSVDGSAGVDVVNGGGERGRRRRQTTEREDRFLLTTRSGSSSSVGDPHSREDRLSRESSRANDGSSGLLGVESSHSGGGGWSLLAFPCGVTDSSSASESVCTPESSSWPSSCSSSSLLALSAAALRRRPEDRGEERF